MMHEADLVIRGGLIADGSGGEPFVGDVAVSGGKIVAVGSNLALRGHEEIEAAGQVVTPGFVDIHTHYDGQVTWENRLRPTSGHGVTTTYLHQSKLDVAVGAHVTRGQKIGEVGHNGRATGPHLCWRLNWFQVQLDPSRSTREAAPSKAA